MRPFLLGHTAPQQLQYLAPSHQQHWQQRQQQQQQQHHHHILCPSIVCKATVTQARSHVPYDPHLPAIERSLTKRLQQLRRPSHVAAAGKDHQQVHKETSTPQQQQKQQQLQQQRQQQPVSKPDPADEDDEGEWDSDDEYEEGEDDYLDEGEWEEEWEDEEEEEGDDGSFLTTTARQIPQNQTTVEFTQDDFVEVGMISRPHGVRGEVKVQLITDEPKKRLGTPGKRLWLQALPVRSGLVPPSVAAARQGAGSDPFKTLRRVVVQSGRVARPGGKGQREEWAVKFEGYNSREKAADLAGYKLLLALCDREARPRGRNEFFIDQLVGLKAVDAASNILVGIVTEVYENGASYSLLRLRLAPEEADIEPSKYRSVLVPFVSEIVPDVDMAGGQLGLSLPEGLLETASVTKLRKAYTPAQQAQLREQLKKRQQQQKEWEQQQQQQQQQQEQQ